MFVSFFFFNDTAPTEIYPLSLHDALPISILRFGPWMPITRVASRSKRTTCRWPKNISSARSEEHTSELQSLAYLVCRLLLEKKDNGKYGYETSALEEQASEYLHTAAPHPP